MLWYNVMERLIEEKYEDMKEHLNCCTCERCRADIIAFALNKLPPKYVVTSEGETYAKLYILKNQNDMDMMSALAMGAKVVSEHPRHEG